jgi:hypothetical protein
MASHCLNKCYWIYPVSLDFRVDNSLTTSMPMLACLVNQYMLT